jgi:formate dehydrogenase assembly factor FdhD
MDTEYEAPLAFAATAEPHNLEIRVNFGVFAGREATPAELEDLAHALVREVGEISIVSEQRHEVSGEVEASVHQVRVELDDARLPAAADERDALVDRLVEAAGAWARACIAERSVEVGDL